MKEHSADQRSVDFFLEDTLIILAWPLTRGGGKKTSASFWVMVLASHSWLARSTSHTARPGTPLSSGLWGGSASSFCGRSRLRTWHTHGAGGGGAPAEL